MGLMGGGYNIFYNAACFYFGWVTRKSSVANINVHQKNRNDCLNTLVGERECIVAGVEHPPHHRAPFYNEFITIQRFYNEILYYHAYL